MIDYETKEICLRSIFKGFPKCTIIYNGIYSLCSIVLKDSSLLYIASSIYMIEPETIKKYNMKGL